MLVRTWGWSTCRWQPQVPASDETVGCLVNYKGNGTAVTAIDIQFNYPPPSPPTIGGYYADDVVQVGLGLTMTCTVRDGKPLVTSVIFQCDGYPDVEPDDVDKVNQPQCKQCPPRSITKSAGSDRLSDCEVDDEFKVKTG
nr:hypothetical protein BaRGS_025243 [Batillaria attramentaria]